MAELKMYSYGENCNGVSLNFEEATKHTSKAVWLDLYKPGKEGRNFLLGCGFHHLAVEDCFSESATRFYVYDDHKFVVLRARDKDSDLDTEYLFIFIRDGLLVTVRNSALPCIDDFAKRFAMRRTQKRSNLGAEYLLYELMDAIADDWYGVLVGYNDRLEELEDHVVDQNTKYPNLLPDLHDMKQELREASKSIEPFLRIVLNLMRPDEGFVPNDCRLFYEDLSSQVAELTDRMDNISSGATSTRDTYLSQTSMRLAESNQRLTEVMTTLTIIGAVMMPLTLIAGIFGMNVTEFGAGGGGPSLMIIFGIMGSFSLLMFGYFWKRGWLKKP